MKEIYTFLNNLFCVKYTEKQWSKFVRIWNLLAEDLDDLDITSLFTEEFDQNIKQLVINSLSGYDIEDIIEFKDGKFIIDLPIKEIEKILNEAD